MKTTRCKFHASEALIGFTSPETLKAEWFKSVGYQRIYPERVKSEFLKKILNGQFIELFCITDHFITCMFKRDVNEYARICIIKLMN